MCNLWTNSTVCVCVCALLFCATAQKKSAASSNHQRVWNDLLHKLQFAPDEITPLSGPSARSHLNIGLCLLWRSWRKTDIESKIQLGVTPPLTDAAAAGQVGLRPFAGLRSPSPPQPAFLSYYLIEGSNDLRHQPCEPHSEEDLCPHHSSAGCLLIKRRRAERQAGAEMLPFVNRCAADSSCDWRERRLTEEEWEYQSREAHI